MKFRLLLVWLLLGLVAPVCAQTSERNRPMTEKKEFALQKVAQIAVTVKDLDRATAFYRDKLGLKHLFKAPSISAFDCSGLTLLLSVVESTGAHSSIVYFEVADIQATVQTLTERGVTIFEKPNKVGQLGQLDVWIAIFRDSEDNLMGLRSMVPRS